MKTIILIIFFPIIAFSQARYEVSCSADLLWLSRQVAINEIGTYERSDRNDGCVVKYLKVVGLSGGYPYCAAGQYYCFLKAAEMLKMHKLCLPVPKTALAKRFFDHGRISGNKTKYYAKIDDLIIWRKGRTVFGHVERVISVQKAGWVTTIAFNVKGKDETEKNREGVFIKHRNIYHPVGRLTVRGLLGFRRSRRDYKR